MTQDSPGMRDANLWRRRLIVIGVGIAAMIIAAMFDTRVAEHFHAAGRAEQFKKTHLAQVMRAPGVFYFTIVLAAVVSSRKIFRWRAAANLMLSGVVFGLIYSLAKWSIGRTRPFKIIEGHTVGPFELMPFRRGFMGLLRAENQSFPSGHTGLAFATAATMAELLPRYWWAFYFWAVLVGVERVAENAHYPSDVVAGAMFGIVSAWIARALVARWLPADDRNAMLADRS